MSPQSINETQGIEAINKIKDQSPLEVFRQFICRACGLVYDEALGDPDSGLPPGTRFEDIPDDWACPLCGVTKADFDPVVPTGSAGSSRAGGPSGAVTPLGQSALSQGPWLRSGRAPGLVIVGGGTAGWALAEAVRARSASMPMTLVSACSADRYDKPRLSVALHQGLEAASLPRESGQAAAERLGVHLLAHTQAAGIDAAHRRLRTTRGTLRFDALVLAHGAATRVCEGLPEAHTWRINDLASYQSLRRALEALPEPRHPGASDVAIVGAGLVGCELANDLALAGYSVCLLEAADRPLPVASNDQSLALLKAWKALPLRFVGGVRLGSVVPAVPAVRSADPALFPGNAPWRISTQDGQAFLAHLLVSAVGLSTPTRLARQAGLRWDQGIVVDPGTLETGVDHVHALGDCISIGGRPQRFIEPIFRQAAIIADRVCGLPSGTYDARCPPIRVKTTSLPLTLAA